MVIMKHTPIILRIFRLVIILVIVSGIALSCTKKSNFIPKSDLLSLPTVTVKNGETVMTDSGKVQLIMSSPLMEKYDNKDSPYTEFRFGIRVYFCRDEKDTIGMVTAKYAKYTATNDLWELKDSVVVVNEKKDKLETELLFWDQRSDLIYTDRFVKISNATMVSQGFGFESDSHLNHQKLKKVSATIIF